MRGGRGGGRVAAERHDAHARDREGTTRNGTSSLAYSPAPRHLLSDGVVLLSSALDFGELGDESYIETDSSFEAKSHATVGNELFGVDQILLVDAERELLVRGRVAIASSALGLAFLQVDTVECSYERAGVNVEVLHPE